MLEISDIQKNLIAQGAIPLYQLSILDFLNQAKVASDIAGDEPQRGPIEDDPLRKGPGGYDIGITVAQRILEKRASLGGRFTNLTQLANIPYFGIDKFNDLVYTFTRLHAPIPTGLGTEFDEYIMALSALEIVAYREGYSDVDALTAIRKIFFDNNIPGPEQIENNLNWDIVIPKASGINPPASWAISSNLFSALRLIENTNSVKVGDAWIDPQILIAGLDARNRPSRVRPTIQGLNIASNQEFATFLLGTSLANFQYLRNFDIPNSDNFSIEQEAYVSSFNTYSGSSGMTAYADSYNIPYNPNQSLTWNLINYYTDESDEAPVKSRFQNLAANFNLGNLTDGIFENDSAAFRNRLVKKVEKATFFQLTENNNTELVIKMLNSPEDRATLAYRAGSAFATDLFIDALYLRVSMEISKPAILSWNRLEARPRTKEFTRPLRAEVRDPLWYLCRQWQFGEFLSEDTGSCLEMRIDMETTKVDHFSLNQDTAQSYDENVPMETTVEREPVQKDLTIRQEMGVHFERLVQAKLAATPGALSATIQKNIKSDFRNISAFQFSPPTPESDFPDVYSDPVLLKTFACLGNGRALDGGSLYDALKLGAVASSFVTSTANASALSRVNDAAAEFITWFESIYNQPAAPTDTAWNPAQLEYQFHCSAPSGASDTTVLGATEYASGNLDWYNFDFETDKNRYDDSLKPNSPDTNLIKKRLISVLPTDLTFPGMPLPRWWAFEDFKVDLGDIKASTTEVPKLLLAEFALIYSNDWMVMPYDVSVGSLCNVKDIIVRDVFGQYTKVRAAGHGSNTDWKRWTMFNLHRRDLLDGPADNRLFVPPAVVRNMESEPLEKVSLIRDEMANMVWGVEHLIPDGKGGNKEGWDAARRLYDYLVEITDDPGPPSALASNDAAIQYQLGTTVPEHWIPFIPMRIGGPQSRQIQLRRAAMPRIIRGRTPERIRPRTELLKTGYNIDTNSWGPYFLHEEEVPRSGTVVERRWQRTRWMNGGVHTWLGRQVRNGRGEANSGLEYDKVVEKST